MLLFCFFFCSSYFVYVCSLIFYPRWVHSFASVSVNLILCCSPIFRMHWDFGFLRLLNGLYIDSAAHTFAGYRSCLYALNPLCSNFALLSSLSVCLSRCFSTYFACLDLSPLEVIWDLLFASSPRFLVAALIALFVVWRKSFLQFYSPHAAYQFLHQLPDRSVVIWIQRARDIFHRFGSTFCFFFIPVYVSFFVSTSFIVVYAQWL